MIKCIGVKSMTYAEKAKKILITNGINAEIRRLNGSESGCGKCIAVKSESVNRAIDIMRKNGILMTGEIKDE